MPEIVRQEGMTVGGGSWGGVCLVGGVGLFFADDLISLLIWLALALGWWG